MTRTRYRFVFRSGAEVVEIEAGPFTPYEAANFGRLEAAKRVMTTGEVWTCNLDKLYDTSTIVEAVSPPDLKSAWWIQLIAYCVVGGLIGGILWMLRHAP